MKLSKRASDAVARLRNEAWRDPGALRREVVGIVKDFAESDIALWYTMTEVDGSYVLDQSVELGTPSWIVPRFQQERIPWVSASPHAPPPHWTRNFLPLSALVPHWETFYQSTVYQRIFAPAGLRDQLRLLIYDEDRFVGWVGALRSSSDPWFRRADARRLAPLVESISTALVRADAMARAARPEEGCDFLVRHDGTVEFASTSGQRWLQEPQARERLAAWLQKVERNRDPVPRHLGGCRIRWSRAQGAGCNRYFLHLEPPAPVIVRPWHQLSATQQRIAELAALGATVSEIGRMLDRSPLTVHSHLREIYRRLEVSNRVELARRVTDGKGPATKAKP